MHLLVTGTDTDVGKTLVAAALLHLCRAQGLRAVGMKPIAAGCDAQGDNADVAALCAASDVAAAPELVNPYRFLPAIAPHIAARDAGVGIDLAHIAACYARLSAQADAVIVEGAGGFLLPLGDAIDGGDLAQRLALPVILVVGMRLGCLNHALLSAEAIARRGLRLAGWVANSPGASMPRYEENLDALQLRLTAPLLGRIACLPSPDPRAAAACLRLPAP